MCKLYSGLSIVLISLFVSGSVFSQQKIPIPSYAWTVTLGDTEHDQGNSIATGEGNLFYIAGQFHGPVDFDPSEDNIEIPYFHGGVWDAFVTTLLPDGSYGGKLYTYGGSGDPIWGGAESIRAIALDNMNNIYITGEFGGEGNIVDFDHTEGIDDHTAVGHTDIFVTKINYDGTYGWTRTMGGSQFEMGRAIAADDNGVYLTGHFMGTVDFDPTDGTDYHTADPTYGNAYITKLNPDGSYGWTRSFGGTSLAPQNGQGIAASPDGTIWVTGMVNSVTDIPGWGEVDSYGWDDIFIAQLDQAGNYLLFYTLGGEAHDNGNAIATDEDGNVYITGRFSQTMDFDPTDGTDIRTAVGGSNIFLIKLSGSGEYLWGYHAEKVGGSGNDWGRSIAFDSMDQGVVVTGVFAGQVDFNPSDEEDIHESQGAYGIFITQLTKEGDYAWTHSIKGPAYKEPYGVTVDNYGNPVITGVFMGTVDFDPTDEEDERTSVENSPDIFILKLLKRDVPVGIEDMYTGYPLQYILYPNYPNPFNPSTTIRFGMPERSIVKLEIYNTLGQRVAELVDGELEAGYHEVVWHSGRAASGLYFYRMETVSKVNPSDHFLNVRSMVLVK